MYGEGRLEAAGNTIGKDFEIRDGGQVVARISASTTTRKNGAGKPCVQGR
jgi:uncharacterized protein YxjI